MNIDRARHLFENDAHPAVFSADHGKFNCPNRRSVNVYPRKSRKGFVFCVWRPGISEDGLSAMIGGGVLRAKSVAGAATEAVRRMFEIIAGEPR